MGKNRREERTSKHGRKKNPTWLARLLCLRITHRPPCLLQLPTKICNADQTVNISRLFHDDRHFSAGENRKGRGGSGPGILDCVLHVLTKGTEVIDTKSQRGESVSHLRLKPITAWTQTTDLIGWTDLNTSTTQRCILLNVMIISGLHTGTAAG